MIARYNQALKLYADAPFEYNHDAGLYYHFVHEDIIVGTQPQTPADVDFLKDREGVTCIMNTQQSKDWKYWNVDFAAVAARCGERDVHLERRPFPDFDSEGLRKGLPQAVAVLDALLRSGHRVYLHCTAGLGRSPGIAIAYLYWFGEYHNVDRAYDSLTSIRPCGPNKLAIRGATADVLRVTDVLSEEDITPLLSKTRELQPLGDDDGATLTAEQHYIIQDALRRSSWGQLALYVQTKLFERKPEVLAPKGGSLLRRITSMVFTGLSLLAAGLFARLLLRVCLAI